MSRSYIGPFGRILPVRDYRNPEGQHLLDDESRTNMATYQLPPPDRLQCGSDYSVGFTEPMRYNTVSQSSRSRVPNDPIYAEQARQLRHEQLPSVRQILTPLTQSSGPQSPFLPQRSPNPSQRPLHLTSDHRGSPTTDRANTGSDFAHGSPYAHPRLLPTQMPLPNNVSPPKEDHQISPSTQKIHPTYMHHHRPSMSPYAPSIETSPQMSYHPQHQQPLPLGFAHHQQLTLSNTRQLQQAVSPNPGHSQQVLAVNTSAQYYQDQSGDYGTAANATMALEQSPSPIVNSVKPMARVVGEQDVSGEGPSWVYEDGTTCKKVIDGEAVNAQWGITKAGKPRKRLAIACTTCREKKIKCDPAEPNCVQCEKFGRKCKFTTAFRVQRGSPGSPSYDSQASTSLINIKPEAPLVLLEAAPSLGSPQVEDQKPLKRRNSLAADTRIMKTLLSSDVKFNKATAAKRQRSSLPGPISTKVERKLCALRTPRSVAES